MKARETAIAKMGLKELLEYETRELNELIQQREKEERENCMRCGRRITDWEEVEQTDTELILTYKCPCGCYADQHYKLVYDRTEEIE